jgi:hypothetical protein
MAGPYFSKSWPPFVYRGKAYALAHLDEYEFTVEDTDHNQHRIAVTFADHCFTRKPISGDDPALAYPDSDRKPGHFCFERYKLTFDLRKHIAYGAKGEVWTVKGENFAAVPMVDQSGKRCLYGIIFSLDRITGLAVSLRMRVRTAHQIDDEIETFGQVRFRHLVALRMKAKRPGRITSPGRKKPKKP